jgi:hypothetical protein
VVASVISCLCFFEDYLFHNPRIFTRVWFFGNTQNYVPMFLSRAPVSVQTFGVNLERS